jgi:hypothetical protein
METSKNKLSDMRLRIIQIAAGIIAAAALFLSISLPKFMELDASSLLNYLFVVVFLVIMMGRRSIENKYRLRLNLFSMTLMDGILGAIIIFAAIALYADQDDVMTRLDNWIKILIIGGLTAILLGLGIAFPLVRYNKRKANGTLAPIRLPEKPEPTESEEEDLDDPDRPLSTEEKIAAMARELEQDNSNDSADDQK